MRQAASSEEVILGICRAQDWTSFISSGMGTEKVPIPKGRRQVSIDRPDLQTSFGFAIQSIVGRPGCMLGT